MTEEEIFAKLKELFLSIEGEESTYDIKMSSRIKEDLELTSVSVLYLIFLIEEFFKIQFQNASLDTFLTVSDVVKYIKERLT